MARTRLYGVVDVALLRGWVRLTAEGGPSVARFARAYLGQEIRHALRQQRASVLIVRGRRVDLVSARRAATIDAAVAIPLNEALEGVAQAIAAVCKEQPEVWAGLDWLTPAEALATA